MIRSLRMYSVAVVGDRHSGKSTWITRVTTGEYQKHYLPTTDRTVSVWRNKTSIGIDFVCELIEYPYSTEEQVDGYIYFTDPGYEGENIISVNSKHDLVEKEERDITNKNNISSRNNINILEPLLYMCRYLFNNQDVYFIDNDPVVPPIVEM